MSEIASIILAAGQGTRMRSKLPKVLHPVAGDPMISYPVRVAQQLGSKKIALILGHGMETVQGVCQNGDGSLGRGVTFLRQAKQLGTADAVKVAQKSLKGFGGNVLILYGDVPLLTLKTLRRFIRFHRQGKQALSLLSMRVPDPTGYGRVIRDEKGQVAQIVEEMSANAAQKKVDEVNTGIFLLSSKELFKQLPRIKKNARKSEYYLTDLVGLLVEQGKSVAAMCADEYEEFIGVNSKAELAVANQQMRERINQEWMDKGVTMLDPGSTYVDKAVALGQDVILGPGCVLRGNTRIKEGSHIDAGCVIVNSRIDQDVHVKPYSVVESSHVESHAQVGPFAHLRPETRVGREAKVGNFVELKKVRLAKGAKANHLSYLGNAVIGEKTNVGAGTITCNYDGFNKFETHIGPRSFIGSDTQLVAPVKLGADSWIAAGTTVTKDVPSGALALSRTDQVHIKNWKRKKAKKTK